MRVFIVAIVLLLGAALSAQISRPMDPIICRTDGDTLAESAKVPFTGPRTKRVASSHFELTFTKDVPAEAEASIRFAAETWETFLVSEVPIRVNIDWRDEGDDRLLASAGPSTIYRSFPGATDPEVWYPVALAESIVGEDLNEVDEPDINVVANSSANWNFDTEGSVPRSRIDLATVILHELAHGMGFLSSIDSTSDTTVSIGFDDRFIIYDLFLKTTEGESLSDATIFRSPSPDLLDAVVNRLDFAGDNAVRENEQEPVPLFAPATFDVGSSVSHQDERSYRAGTPNALMTPSIANGEGIRTPGPVILGILEDIGWNVVYDPNAVANPVAETLRIFPNPATTHFTIALDGLTAAPTIAILYAADGREVRRQMVSPQRSTLDVDIAGLPPGMYTVFLPGPTTSVSGRVMIR